MARIVKNVRSSGGTPLRNKEDVMISRARSVAAYLEEVPVERREALRRLRALCRKVLTDYDEGMEYGMPSYKRDGKVEVGFASQRRSINLYILNQEALEKSRHRLNGLSVGKGCIRYSRPDRMDFDVIADLLKDTVASTAGPC